ncbi:MAG TPA: class I SAM-dependent methyltransferase [Burkholderiaceae bacterium]|nr:class I SAM-dependent methyltransferase [Burkholderiaceae bacterium]
MNLDPASGADDDHDETRAVAERYARRAVGDRYNPLRPEIWQARQERQRALIALLRRHAPRPLAQLDVLEVGCGHGDNLLELLQLGFDPARLVANELLPQRLAEARRRLPGIVALHGGDALALGLADASFDIVLQSTVFTSLLDDDFQQRLAERMWRWLRPGGGVLWYDFCWDNPRNRDVRAVPLARVRELFPHGRLDARRVTLAPPIARRVCRLHPALYTVLNAVPLLRTHVLAWIGKPAFEPFAARPGVRTTNADVDALRDVEGI